MYFPILMIIENMNNEWNCSRKGRVCAANEGFPKESFGTPSKIESPGALLTITKQLKGLGLTLLNYFGNNDID